MILDYSKLEMKNSVPWCVSFCVCLSTVLLSVLSIICERMVAAPGRQFSRMPRCSLVHDVFDEEHERIQFAIWHKMYDFGYGTAFYNERDDRLHCVDDFVMD